MVKKSSKEDIKTILSTGQREKGRAYKRRAQREREKERVYR